MPATTFLAHWAGALNASCNCCADKNFRRKSVHTIPPFANPAPIQFRRLPVSVTHAYVTIKRLKGRFLLIQK
ncbi:hypothetical protein [Noviherbaspirillum sp.]|uniref:hypothetical protein n=1 Tax=Noviherbaspirillum sp. TaxID=1926288 RepID=UPI002FE28AA5